MGTVGLSFGAPTSGTGFNVSTTVAQIVNNLKAVETPWNTQLTTLQGQDKQLSNLGTLLSNLSNDVRQFTDFQGILATKSGSSSNNSVLQLTGASPSSVAGTHTIVVNSLAQTSSGYLASITNASDTLSGSITIQVGSGTAQTIPVGSSSNTLAGLSAAINAAGIGVTANIITDANGSRLSLVSGISGATGDLTVTSAITDNTTSTSLGYTASQTGVNATLSVDGISISNASNTVANVIPGVTFQLLSSSPGTQISVVVANDTAAVESVMGAFVSDYNAVISTINTQEGNDSSGIPQPLYGSPTLSLLQQQILGAMATQNPTGYLDAVANSADTLSGSMTIQVGAGSPQTIPINSGNNTLSGLANAINTANIGVTANVTTNASGSYLELVSQTAGSSGALSVTSALTDATTSTALNYNNAGTDISGLTSLGISVNNDGTLTLNKTSLSTVLTNDYSGVVGFFQNANSWGQNFSINLTHAGSGTTGIIGLGLSSNSNIESNLNTDISNENNLISVEEKSLTAEMNSVNQLLQSLPAKINQENQLYAAITGYNQTNR